MKQACLVPSHPQCRVRTYAGEFQVQTSDDGTAAGYQAYLEYVQHAPLTEVAVSRWLRQGDGSDILAGENVAPGSDKSYETFHRRVAGVICQLMGKQRVSAKQQS